MKPEKFERKKKFIKRCIPYIFNEEEDSLTSKDKKSKQAYAICNSKFDNRNEGLITTFENYDFDIDDDFDDEEFDPTVNINVKLTIGDWSGDGHEEYDIYVYQVNYPVDVIQQSYKDSCKLTGIQFNHNDKYVDIPGSIWNMGNDRIVCTEYDDYMISNNAKEILRNHNIPDRFYMGDYIDPEKFSILILEFIKLTLPKLEYKEGLYKKSELNNMSAINGWWNDTLNVQFGYGLYE